MSASPPTDFAARIATIERLIGEIEQTASPEVLARVQALVTAVLELHGTGMRQAVARIEERAPGADVLPTLAADDLVGALLALHGLHPVPVGERVADAVGRVRAELLRKGLRVEVVALEGERAHLRVHAELPGQSAKLRARIEELLLTRAPDAHVELDLVEPPDGAFVPAARLGSQGESS